MEDYGNKLGRSNLFIEEKDTARLLKQKEIFDELYPKRYDEMMALSQKLIITVWCIISHLKK